MIGGKRVIAIVPARAGSQRLAGKNVRPLAGRPMIGWTLAAAQASTVLDRLVVSSDDPAVLALAEAMGCPAPFVRPASLSGPDASLVDVVDHALEAVGGVWDQVVLLQPTSPLRQAADVDGAVALANAREAPAVVGVSPLPKPEGFYVSLDDMGVVGPPSPGLAQTCVINGAIYVIQRDVLARERTFRPAGTLGYVMPPERGWDVDTGGEFAACEALLSAEPGNKTT